MQISKYKIKRMKRLLTRFENKKFDTDDKEELATLAAYFLFCAKAIDYTDGYGLTV